MIKVQLIVVQGRPEGRMIPLAGPVFLIGREEGCHLRPSSDEISRRHAEIRIWSEAATVRDLGSRNGTFVNGRRVAEPTALKSGDLIKVGPLTFAVSIQGAAGAAAPAKPGPTTKSLDEVGHDEVASWLIADDKHPVPDRPSAVYKGETITIEAYLEEASRKAAGQAKPAAAQPVTETAEHPQQAPKPAAAVPEPAAAAASAPATPPAPPPTPQPTVEAKPAPAAAPSPPPAAPRPAAARPTPSPAPSHAASPPRSIWDEIDFIERLPEGAGDAEPEAAPEESAAEGEEAGAAAEETMPEEWIDESNPFYAARKKGAAGEPGAKAMPETAKPSFKDSSEAANAILKRMLERRKGGG